MVHVTTDHGKAPTLSVAKTDKLLAVAAEWRETLSPLAAERSALLEAKSSGWIERSRYDRLVDLCRIIGKAKTAKSHAGRMKLLRSLALA